MRQPPREHVAVELLAEIVARENQCAAGVFFFREAEKIGGEAQLRLHLFFAIAKIIVGNNRNDDAGFVARRELEGVAAVVKFVLGFPAHPVAALALRRRNPKCGRPTDFFVSRMPGAAQGRCSRCGRSNARCRARRRFPAAAGRRRFQKSPRQNRGCSPGCPARRSGLPSVFPA
jgi:hypothetical protein